jgi:hypothetical protein
VVPGRVQRSDRGTNRDRFPGADFTGDRPERGLVDAVVDAGNRLGVGIATEES